MQILGIVFVGTRTPQRAAMSAFVRDVLRLERLEVAGIEADLFGLPSGDAFAVSDGGAETGDRTIGLLVADLDAAIEELHAAGVATDGVAENARWRYTHFTAPDGKLYELVEERS